MDASPETRLTRNSVIAICGNPNCGKTTIFNAITGLRQQVGNYPGVTVERVSGQFSLHDFPSERFTLVDIPGTYSLSAFTPDEYIAASALFGDLKSEARPDGIITVIDATNLERGLYFLFQVLQIGVPVTVALNMVDLAERKGLQIDCDKLSDELGGVPVVAVVGSKGKGIDELKSRIVEQIGSVSVGHIGHRHRERSRVRRRAHGRHRYDDITESVLAEFINRYGNSHHTRAHYVRVLFDQDGPAEAEFVRRHGAEARVFLDESRRQIREKFGALTVAETRVLTGWAAQVASSVTVNARPNQRTLSERVDRFLLHPILGPIFLVMIMVLVFQSIFSWAAPFMNLIDAAFGWLSTLVGGHMAEGPLRSLLTDGVIGGVGSVLIFVPQIVILFVFIALLEDSGYMTRAAFLVDRTFRWCGLSGKSFIPMLSSFACAVPGIMATRTIEDRKLRFMTIMVAPLMTCSARLPVYAVMIAAFIPYKVFLGMFNLQGLVLTLLYALGMVVAVMVSFVLKKTVFKTERGTFMMEMPSYKVPVFKSVAIRVLNRVKTFVVRAGTVILAITVIIWALSYYPRSEEAATQFEASKLARTTAWQAVQDDTNQKLSSILTAVPVDQKSAVSAMADTLAAIGTSESLRTKADALSAKYPERADALQLYAQLDQQKIAYNSSMNDLAHEWAGVQIRNSYLGRFGRSVGFLFEPLGWDWKITMAVLASFPAREVIVATLGTIYNLGADVNEESSSLIDKMHQAKWEEGPKTGKHVFSPSVALSIMVFFALCCQCGATLVTIKQETRHWIYPVAVFSYMTILAYVGALVTYQIFSRMGL